MEQIMIFMQKEICGSLSRAILLLMMIWHEL